MAFHEVQFPPRISYGSRGGPERRTTVVTAGGGAEARNQQWADSRRKYSAGTGIKTIDQLYAVVAFFEERRGKFHGFRWKDWSDFRSGAPNAAVTASDQRIGTGDGTTKTFQLSKVYGTTYAPWTRAIVKPVAGTVVVSLNGTPQGSGWTVDTTTGLVTFGTAPGSGVIVRAGFEFDVPVRFDADYLEFDLPAFELGQVPSVPIIEIRT